MKLKRRSVLLSLVLALIMCITGMGMAAFADETSTATTAVSGIQAVRDGKILLFLTGTPYADVNATTAIGTKMDTVNLMQKIKLYALDGSSITLGEVWDENKDNSHFNVWGEPNCVAFTFKSTNTYNAITIWKIEIEAGTQFPAGTDDSPVLVTENAAVFYNTYSTTDLQVGDMASWSTNEGDVNTTNKAAYKAQWEEEHPPVDPGRVDPIQTPVAIYDTKNGIAQLHFRGEIRENGTPDIKMLIFLSKSDYEGATVGINGGSAVYADYYNDYNTMDKILLWTSDTEYVTLKQAFTSTGATYEAYYNIWGEQNCVAFQLGQYKADDFVRVTIMEGCEFPSYQHTSGAENLKDVFVTTQTVEFVDWSPSPDFSTNWRVDRSRGNAAVESVDCDSQGKISFTLSGTDYDSAQEETNLEAMAETTNLYQYVLIDGKTLESYIGSSVVNGYVTQDGTFSLTVSSLSEATRIIIKKGAQFPAFNNSEMNVECYNVGYYETSEAVMFVKNAQGVWEKAANITWTVTFDGADAVEVEDGGTIPADKIPSGNPQAGYRIEWMSGQVVFDFSTPITGYVNLTSEQIRQYTVTFDTAGGSEVASLTADAGATVTKPADPTREGYTFVGWYVGNDEFNFNAPLTADVTVTAKWTSTGGASDKKGCGGEIAFESFAAASGILALFATAVILRKKKKD